MWDAGVPGRPPALLTQSILFLVPEDLDLCLKRQTDRHPPGSRGGLIPLGGEGNLPFPQGWMKAEAHKGQVYCS